MTEPRTDEDVSEPEVDVDVIADLDAPPDEAEAVIGGTTNCGHQANSGRCATGV